MIGLCKFLLLGDSLMFALSGHMSHDINMGVVGDSISGTIQRVEKQGAPECDFTIVGLGSNVLFNGVESEIQKYDILLQKLGKRKIFVMPVPAKGKFLNNANKFNKQLKQLSKKYDNVVYVPLLPEIRSNLQRDGVHLTRKANRTWKNQILSLIPAQVYRQRNK